MSDMKLPYNGSDHWTMSPSIVCSDWFTYCFSLTFYILEHSWLKHQRLLHMKYFHMILRKIMNMELLKSSCEIV